MNRLKGYGYSLSGVYWEVQINDTDHYGSSTEVKLSSEIFGLNYKGVTERMDPFFTSEVSVTIFPDSTSTTAIDQLLTVINASQEERIYCDVYRNSVLYWRGQLLPDQIEREDIQYPPLTLKFTDGLARLKDVDYNNNGAPWTGRATVLNHIFKCLLKTGMDEYYGANDYFLKTGVNWYDIHHVVGMAVDPLNYTDIAHENFYTIEDDGTYTYMKAYDVLEMLLRTFNARILMYGGYYHIIQAQELTRTYMSTRVYSKSAAMKWSGWENFKVTQSFTNRTAGGVFKNYPTLRRASKLYKYRLSNNYNQSLIPVATQYETPVAMNAVLQGGDGEYLMIFGNVNHSLYRFSGTATVDLIVKFKLAIVLTLESDSSKRYLGPGGYWTTNASDAVYFYSPMMSGYFWNTTFGISQYTTEIPEAATATFEFEDVQFLNGQNQVITLPAGLVYTYTCQSFTVLLKTSNGANLVSEGEIEYKSDNILTGGTLTNSTLELKVKETTIGDGPSAYSLGRLKTSNGSTWVNGSLWAPYSQTSRLTINQLSVDQILKGQRTPTMKYMGGWRNYLINALTAVSWDDKVYVPLSLTIYPALDEVSGEWFNAATPAIV